MTETKRKPGLPEKKLRNAEMREKRRKDPEEWSYRKLGEHYGIHWTRVSQILKSMEV